MKISIVIPVYNGEKHLDKIFKSLKEQTVQDFQIICIDDGSTDSSYKKLIEKSKEFNEMIVISQENKGPGEARKKGLEKASGTHVIFIDCDDYLRSEKTIETILKTLSIYPKIDLIVSDLLITKSTGINIIPFIREKTSLDKIYDQELPISYLENKIFATNFPGKVYKKKILKANMFISTYNYEDYYTNLEYLEKCKNFIYISEVLYMINYFDNHNSLTKNIDFKKIHNTAIIIKKISEKPKFKELKKYVAFDIYCFYSKLIFINKKKYSKQEKYATIKELKKLRKLFSGEVLRICFRYFGLKRLILYLSSYIFLLGDD